MNDVDDFLNTCKDRTDVCDTLTHDSVLRGKYYRYMFFAGVTLEPLLSVSLLGVDDIKPQTMGWGNLTRGMAAVESMTPETDWVLGEQFTAADVVFGGALAFFTGFKVMEASPKVASYVERLQARPARQASLVKA